MSAFSVAGNRQQLPQPTARRDRPLERKAKIVESFSFYHFIMSDRELRDMQEQIDAVQRMQDYIGSHLTEEITPADLAGVSLFSPWYSYRLFTRQTGTTPADYIRRMRLSKSALKLRDDAGKCRCGVRNGLWQRGRISEGIFAGVWLQSRGLCSKSGSFISFYTLRR